MDWLADPLQYAFFSRALAAAVIVGIACPVLGTYVVLRGMAFFGEALAHTILPGVVIAFLLGLPLALGALVFGVATALGIGFLTNRAPLREDTAIGVILAGMFALGVALLSRSGSYTLDLAHFLFGNLLGVAAADLWVIGGLGAAALAAVYLFYKELMIITFDEMLADTLRLPAAFLRNLLLVLVAVTVVTALQVVGIALALALLVTPAATASLVTRRLPAMMAVSAGVGVFSGVAGVYASYYLNVAPGAAVVLVATLVFGVVFVFGPGRGLAWQR
jgi:ABC-type Mn2+/Zn2+ transport system permease subunit